MSNRLLKQSAIYSIGKIFVFIAGLISYPVLTKNLSISDYGTVALYTVTIGLMTSFIKLGLQHSIIRFYSELKYNIYISNITVLSILVLITTSLLLALLSSISILFTGFVPFESTIIIILILSALLQAIQSYIINILVAKEQSTLVSSIGVLYRFITLLLMLVAILIIEASATAFILSLLLSDIIFITVLITWSLRYRYFSGFSFSLINKTIYKSMLIFSIPMLGYELANMVHAFIDRFMIEFFMGKQALGLYSASYNMANLIGNLIVGSIGTAIVPIYLDTWSKHGKQKTELLLSRVNSIFILFIPAIIAGLYSISEPLMGLLATEEYKRTSYILPIVSIGVFLFGTSVIYAAGLQINKSTKKLFRYVLESAFINIVLNYLTIPTYGLLAASVNTVISYLWMATRFYFEGCKTVKVKFDIYMMLRSFMYATLLYLCLYFIKIESYFLDCLSKISVGALVYIILFVSIERHYNRELSDLFINWFNSRWHTNR